MNGSRCGGLFYDSWSRHYVALGYMMVERASAIAERDPYAGCRLRALLDARIAVCRRRSKRSRAPRAALRRRAFTACSRVYGIHHPRLRAAEGTNPR